MHWRRLSTEVEFVDNMVLYTVTLQVTVFFVLIYRNNCLNLGFTVFSLHFLKNLISFDYLCVLTCGVNIINL